MKLVFLAATALMATPALAQTTTQTDTTAQAGAQTGTSTDATAQTGTSTDTATPGAMQANAAASAATMTAGGYQPAQPPMAAPPAPGAQIVFQQAPSPSQAYPAPAPLKSYPICKKGQYDQCRQRGGN
ncbi:hypothetical protein SOM26_01345 [Sphingomonas sp. CFBP8993]|uniref:hypothetical protein n=1 Tax=Sphingomonas sp. CFBP8993 TaxID=3096526 RepID=UPI002A6A34F6|nr:hypothetical protein [Sphingomonas sp. CFBP8993]MDY0957323.1 hypothetical protein [Sphingomonas sp. CFBP8993]